MLLAFVGLSFNPDPWIGNKQGPFVRSSRAPKYQRRQTIGLIDEYVLLTGILVLDREINTLDVPAHKRRPQPGEMTA